MNHYSDFLLFMLLFGAVVSFVVIAGLTLLKWGKVEYIEDYEAFNLQDALYKEVSFKPVRYGESAFFKFLYEINVPTEAKLKAIITLEQDRTPKSIALLRKALSSVDDEVRLFAFVAINKLENNINASIQKNLEKLKEVEDEQQQAIIKGEIAFLYWDMLYYRVVDEEMKTFILSQIEKYAEEARRFLGNEPKLLFLIFAVKLERGEYKEAEELMEILLEFEFMEDKVAPQLAELYYKMGKFDKIKYIFNRFYYLYFDVDLNPIIELWTSHAYKKG